MSNIVDERQSTHGDFRRTARAYDKDPLRMSFDMIRVKMARIECGDSRCEEHWRDIAGYVSIALAIIRGDEHE